MAGLDKKAALCKKLPQIQLLFGVRKDTVLGHSANMAELFSYDRYKYPSLVFEYIRPDRLGAMAALHGLNISNIERWRILELGCGDGANLMSIAYSMPDTDCVGIDLSTERIREGRETAESLGLDNIRLLHLDVMGFDPAEFGKFDLVIAHGLFSWVPDPVRQKVLEIFASTLKENGFGYISYNTYPGWYFQHVVRDALRTGAGSSDDPEKQVQQAMGFLHFLADSARPDSVHKKYLEEEIVALEKRDPGSVFHDQLSENNQPFYVTEFCEMLRHKGLRFFAEAEPVSHFVKSFPPAAQEAIARSLDDPVKCEQLRDHIRFTRFRSSLICLEGSEGSYLPDASVIENLFLASRSRPVDDNSDLTDNSSVDFYGPKESVFGTNHPFTKTLLGVLSKKWPERMPFSRAADEIRSSFPAMADQEFAERLKELCAYTMDLYFANVIHFFALDPARLHTIPERPNVSAFARWQAESGQSGATGIPGAAILIENDVMRAALIYCDGTRTRDELVEELKALFEVPENERESFARALNSSVDDYLNRFLSAGLYVEK